RGTPPEWVRPAAAWSSRASVVAYGCGFATTTGDLSLTPAASTAARVPGWSAGMTGRSGAAAAVMIPAQARIASGERFSARWTVANRERPRAGGAPPRLALAGRPPR